MGQAPLTEDQCREALAAFETHGNQYTAADALGIPRPTFQNRLRTAIKRGLDQAIVHPAPQGHNIKGVSTLYDADGNVLTQWVKTKADGPSLTPFTYPAMSG